MKQRFIAMLLITAMFLTSAPASPDKLHAEEVDFTAETVEVTDPENTEAEETETLQTVISDVWEEDTENVMNEDTDELSSDLVEDTDEKEDELDIAQIEERKADVKSGTCGKNVTWEYDNGDLTISGTGAIEKRIAFCGLNVEKIKTVTICNGVTVIPDFTFCECINLTSVSIPESVTNIESFAFNNCSSLTDIHFSKGINSSKGVMIIEGFAFNKCSSLTSLSVPGCVKTIEPFAFDDCISLKCVNISNGVEIIESGAFNRCSSLEEVSIPDSLTYIDIYSFENCKNIKKVTVKSDRIIPEFIAHTEFGLSREIDPNIIIYCGKNSEAHKYAKEQGVKYKLFPSCDIHSWKTRETLKKATYTEPGKKRIYCKNCYEVRTETIPVKEKTNISLCKVSLSYTDTTYTGTALKPTVSLTYNGKTVSTSYYSVSYTNNVNVGKATVKITAKTGNYPYKGSVGKTFTINPKGTSITSLTAVTRGFTVKWEKQAVQTTGYQLQYATKSDFSDKVTKTFTATTTVSRTISDLRAKTKYYVRVRTYKAVGTTKYCSDWSAKKYVTTK